MMAATPGRTEPLRQFDTGELRPVPGRHHAHRRGEGPTTARMTCRRISRGAALNALRLRDIHHAVDRSFYSFGK